MSQLPENSREAVQYLLKTRGQQTAKELAEKIEISATAVRQLLTQLSADSLVSSTPVKQPQGRPTHVYTLTSAGHGLFPDNYRSAAIQMLEAVRQIGGDEMVREVVDRQLEGLEAKYRSELAGLSMPEKLDAIDRLRSDEGFMAEIEGRASDGDSVAIVERHCPIYAVAKAFPDLCAAEHGLLERVLEAKLEQTHNMMDGEQYCRFVISDDTPPLQIDDVSSSD